MLRRSRPPRPADFDERVAADRQKVAQKVALGFTPTEDDFPSLWTDDAWQRAFLHAQKWRCGYCESSLHSQSPAIDHFRPKGKVSHLHPERAQQGHEIPGTTRARDRKTCCDTPTGYWWLAYAWENWVLSCERCNTGWKRTFFPVASGHVCAPTQGVDDAALLLDPFGDEDPSQHLRFDSVGAIEPRDGSPLGLATIETCGLWRPSLVEQRAEVARKVTGLVSRFVRELPQGPGDLCHMTDAVGDLLCCGDESMQFAGMVRSLVRDALDLDWEQLRALADVASRASFNEPRDR